MAEQVRQSGRRERRRASIEEQLGPAPSTEGLEELIPPPPYEEVMVRQEEEPPMAVAGPSRIIEKQPSAPPMAVAREDPKSIAIAKEILNEMTESDITTETEKGFGGLRTYVKKFTCGDTEFEPNMFKNYPDYPQKSKLSLDVWQALVKEIEKFVTTELDYTLVYCSSNVTTYQCQNDINKFVNFIRCFKQGGGKSSKLGYSVYPEWFGICTRIKWFLSEDNRKQLKEYLDPLHKKCNFNEWNFENITEILYQTPISSLSQKDINIFSSGGQPFLSAQLQFINYPYERNEKGRRLVGLFTYHGTEHYYENAPVKIQERVKCLLKRGVNPNQRSLLYKFTPLHIFMTNKYLLKLPIEIVQNIVRMLVDSGADINAKTIIDGYTILIILFLNQKLVKRDTGTYLNNKFKMTQKEFYERMNNILKILLKYGANIESGTKQKNTPLHYASQNCDKDVVELLIQNGANVNSKNFQDNTPLHLVSQNCDKDVVELLIQNGANVNSKNFQDNTPFALCNCVW